MSLFLSKRLPNKPYILFSLLLLTSSFLFSQGLYHKNYTFDTAFTDILVPIQFEDEPELILKEVYSSEFKYIENQLSEYVLFHQAILVKTPESIEKNNRIYLPFNFNVEVITLKARIITPGGLVKELKEEDIKEAKDEATQRTIKYFALEGLEKESIIEHYYVIKRSPNLNGTVYTAQSGTAKLNHIFEIISPKNLVFAFKGYNGFPLPKADTSNSKISILRTEQQNIPPFEPEEMAVDGPNMISILYKLDKNLDKNPQEMGGYKDIVHQFANKVWRNLNKKESKILSKILKDIDLKNTKDEAEKVKTIENYVKTRFKITNQRMPDMETLEFMYKNNYTNESGIVFLFAQLYYAAKIRHEIVLTTDRNKIKFDPDFESYIFLNDYLMYFPDINEYIAPTQAFSKLGYIPAYNTANYGLFIQYLKVGDQTTGISKIEYIKAPSQEKTQDIIESHVTFENILEPIVTMKKSTSGYYAMNVQTIYELLNDDARAQVDESMIKFISENVEIISKSIENVGLNDFGNKPMIVNATFKAPELIENAGNKYLFKIGDLIGPQVEMYQDKTRKYEVENSFNRLYTRKLSFDIPAGYKVENLEKLNMDFQYSFKGNSDPEMAFTSFYRVEGNKVNVLVKEYYTEIVIPIYHFEEYRKVINAAADFNKITLVLSPEN